MFDESAHSRLRDPAPSKNLHGVPRGVLRGLSAVHFQERDLAGKLGRLLLVRLEARQ
jgi:hypothetical protein